MSISIPQAESIPGSATTGRAAAPLLSVVTVTFESGETLPALWPALSAELRRVGHTEFFLVDNASADNSLVVAKGIAAETETWQDGPCQVHLIANRHNIGFGRATNQALARAGGRFVLLLNPDTVIEGGAIERSLAYLSDHPDVGIVGARVLLSDGRLDAPCRRSFKTPATYLYKLTGLSRMFPRSKRFGRYYLSYMDEGQTIDVDSVIGAYLLIRREVIDQIGHLDVQFFMYCEDEDWCFRAKAAGWRVVYLADAVVWHRKGASSSTRKTRMIVQWHRSIYRFHRKNLAPSYPAAVNWAVYAGMLASLAFSTARSILRGPALRARRWLASAALRAR